MSEHPGPESDSSGHAEATESPAPEPEVVDGQALVTHLVDAGVLVERHDDLQLTDEFRENWRERISRFRGEERAHEQMATILDIDPEEVTLDASGDRFVVSHEGTELGDWPSWPAFVADLALQPTMAGRLPLWDRLDSLSRGELLSRLRAFLETCPICEEPLLAEERDGGPEGEEVSIACVDCGRVLVRGRL